MDQEERLFSDWMPLKAVRPCKAFWPHEAAFSQLVSFCQHLDFHLHTLDHGGFNKNKQKCHFFVIVMTFDPC